MMNRKDAILVAAAEIFGRFGYRGTSLRDIARDAGVSLTLLAHHFGSKSALFSAVIDLHRLVLLERADGLRRLITSDEPFSPRDLVDAWTHFAFDASSTPEGRRLLRLMARVFEGPSEESHDGPSPALDEASLLFIDGLQRCYPRASSRALGAAMAAVHGATLKVILGSVEVPQLAGRREFDVKDGEHLARFLLAGLHATLEDASLGSSSQVLQASTVG